MPLPVILVTVAEAALSSSNTISVRSSKSVTSSVKVMVTSNAPFAAVGTVIVSIPGGFVSTVTSCEDNDASFPFPAASSATFSGTRTLTLPALCPVGVMVAMYAVPLSTGSILIPMSVVSVTAVTVALTLFTVSAISVFSSPVTGSLNSIRTLNAPFCGSLAKGRSVIMVVGRIVSISAVYSDDTVLPLFAASTTAFAGTEIFISPSTSAGGVMVSVYSLSPSSPLKLTVAVPVPSVSVVVSEMSSTVKPDTGSSKVIFTSNALFCGVVGTPIVSTFGAFLSTRTVSTFEAVLSLLEASLAAPAGTDIFMTPSTSSGGLITAMYLVTALMSVVAVPVPSVSSSVSEMSPALKPITGSLKVIATSKFSFCGLSNTADLAVTLTVGGVVSKSVMVTVWVDEAILPLFAASTALSAGTEIFKLPVVLGMIFAVYFLSLSVVKLFTVAVAVPLSEMSLASKPDTACVDSKVTTNPPIVAIAGTFLILTSGCSVSTGTVTAVANAVLPSPAAFSATFSATEIITSPSASSSGVIVALYTAEEVSLTVTVAFTVPLSVMSSASKPVTGSSNPIVPSNAPVCTAVGRSVIVTPGRVGSTENLFDVAAFLLPAASSAVFACAVTSTKPSVVGVIVAVYVVPLTVMKLPTVAVALPPSEMSPTSNSVTAS